jgi:hypothetical protein
MAPTNSDPGAAENAEAMGLNLAERRPDRIAKKDAEAAAPGGAAGGGRNANERIEPPLNPAHRRKARAHLRHLGAMRDRAVEASAALDAARKDLQESRPDAAALNHAQGAALGGTNALDDIVEYLDGQIARELTP